MALLICLAVSYEDGYPRLLCVNLKNNEDLRMEGTEADSCIRANTPPPEIMGV